MTTTDVKTFLEAIGTTDWEIDYTEFCNRLGAGPNARYGQQWKQWKALTSVARTFDAETLAKILGVAQPPIDVKRWNELLSLAGQRRLTESEQSELETIEKAQERQQPNEPSY